MKARKLSVVVTLCFATLLHPAITSSADYEAHEWGTFTTLSDPNGRLLTGLEVEEESLPRFVHNLASMMPDPGAREDYFIPHFPPSNLYPGFGTQSKGIGVKVKNVTVKMETPVIYFYSENEEPFPVKVNVGFAGGSISQWYPQRSGGEERPTFTTPSLAVDFADRNYQGAIEWNINVLPPVENPNFEVIKASDTPSWIHPRLPDSNIITSRDQPYEKEKYLFYRGIGNFELPAKFRQTGNDEVVINAEMPLPYALVYQRNGTGARAKLLHDLPAGETVVNFSGKEAFQPLREIQSGMLSDFQQELVLAGLSMEEAESMLLTWWKSYFVQRGTRVFWGVPESEVDRILPLEMEPAPKNLERVIVGRAELISPEEEERIKTQFSKADQDENNLRSSRYFKAYQSRYAPLVAGK